MSSGRILPPLLPAWLRVPALVVVAGIPALQAQGVTIFPRHAVLGPGETCQFQARLDPAPSDHPAAFIWTLVDPERQPVPEAAGSVSAAGLYQAPGVGPDRPRTILVRAQEAGDPARFETAQVTLVPAQGGAWAMPLPPGDQVPHAAGPGDPTGESKAAPAPLPRSVSLEEIKALAPTAHLRPRPGLEIPNPPFSLLGLDPRRQATPAVAQQWRDLLGLEIDPALRQEWLEHLAHPVPAALPAHRFAIFHGIGMSSQRRLLRSHYENADDLGTGQVFALSPWVVLALRNGISTTLIDVTRPRTWYPIGFLLDVPLECIFVASPADAMVPMEGVPFDQKAFRERFRHENPLSADQEAAFDAFVQSYQIAHPRVGLRLAELERLKQAFEQQTGIIPTRAYGPAEPLRPLRPGGGASLPP